MAVTLELPFARVDLERRVVERPDGTRDRLTAVEAGLLRYLQDRLGSVVSRDDLLANVWGYAPATFSRTCDTAVLRLRQKLELDPSDPECLLTVHGGGYVLTTGTPEAQADPSPAAASSGRRIHLGALVVDLGRARVEGPTGASPLTDREVAVLGHLADAGSASIERDVLQRRIWGSGAGRGLANTVMRLRRKIEVDPTKPQFLITTARGYRLEVAGDADPAGPQPLETSLPAEVDASFGREAERDAVRQAFAAGERLVTITGPGGAGKTRLAQVAAWALAEERPAVWVDLAEAHTPERLAAALAAALQVRLGDEDPLGQIARATRTLGPVLVVLDNLEQLVPHGVTAIRTVLEQAPEAWMLATSRVPLGLRGERRLPLGPLDVAAAVALFLGRAPVPPDPDDPDLVPLIDELGGLPLAIELAASRTPVLSVRELRARLTDRLAILAVSDPSRPARHRSLRACLDGSVTLLGDPARTAFPQLAVFAGRFDLPAAEEVLAPDPATLPVDALQELVEAGLVAGDADPGWFSLPAYVREYARELLGADRPAAEGRHRRMYAALGLPAALAALDGPGGADAAAGLTHRFDDLVRAVESGIAANDGPAAVHAAFAAWEVLAGVGPYAVALGWVDRLVALPLDEELRARARLLAGRVRCAAGALGDAVADLTEAARLAAALGSADVGARAHLELAALWARSDRPAGQAADPHADADVALGLARVLGDDVLVCRALCATGRSRLGRYRTEEAREVLEAALGLARALGSQRLEGEARRWLGLALDRLTRPEGRQELRRAARIAVDLGDRRLEAEIQLDMARLGQSAWHAWGAEALDAAIRGFERLGDRGGLAEALDSLATREVNGDQLDRAEAALDRAESLVRSVGGIVRAKHTVTRGVVERLRGRLEAADRLFDEVIRGDHEGPAAAARGQQGWVALARGDRPEARRIWEEAAAISARLGEQQAVVNLENWLGVASMGDDLDRAVAHWDRSAELAWASDFASAALQATGNAASQLAEAGRGEEALARVRPLEALDFAASPALGIMRAIAVGGTEVTLGHDATRWADEADRLAAAHGITRWSDLRAALRR